MDGQVAPENRKHYPGLDGLRAVAVLLVMFEHNIRLPPQYHWGWTGVLVFFVLSGFLITGILYDTRDAQGRWRVFYARRALRIFPLYYAALLLGVLTFPFFRWRLHPSQLLWPVYLQNYARFLWPSAIDSGVIDHLVSQRFAGKGVLLLYGHFWSLAMEEQFYLVWPFIVFAVRRRETLMKICGAVILLSPLARYLCIVHLPVHIVSAGITLRFTLLQCDSLLMGALFALWLRGDHPDFTKLAKVVLLAVGVVVLVACFVCPHRYGRPLEPAIGDTIFGTVGLSIVDLGAAALMLLAIDGRTWLSRALQNRVLRYLGTISYGIYIFHDMPRLAHLRVAKHLTKGSSGTLATDLVCLTIVLVSTVAIASASYYGFERPFLRLKARFTVRAQRDQVLV